MSESERAELARLRKEIVELRMQRDVLKQALLRCAIARHRRRKIFARVRPIGS